MRKNMNQEKSFLEAIRARPGSNQVRLIYADWLEEQGDPRGDFIRRQCQAAGLASWNPRRLALESEAHALLLRHEADWLGPMLGAVSNWEFSRGLLRSVTVDAATFLAQAEKWLPALPLLGLHLRKAHGHVAALAACPQLAHLTGLYLGDNDLTDDDLNELVRSPHLHRLRELYLQSNHLSEKGIRALSASAGLPRLQDLNLAANRLNSSGIEALVRSPHLKRLKHLNLTTTFLGMHGVQTLAASDLLSRLHTLILSCNLLPAGCPRALAESGGFARLRALHYDLNDAADDDVQALASSPQGKNLRALSLSSNRALTDASLTALATSPHLQNLRTLSFGDCKYGQAGLKALGRSRTLRALRFLHLIRSEAERHASFGDLLGGSLVRRLRALSLESISVGADLAALASQPAPLRLRWLAFTLGSGGAPSWETLLARGTLSQLTELTVIDLPPTSLQTMLAPGRLPQLCTLRLYGLPPDLEEVQSFLQSPLSGQLQDLRLAPRHEEQGQELLLRLTRSSATAKLQHLDLSWKLTPEEVRLLTAEATWPELTSLIIGSFRLGTAGAQMLAASPLLGQLRFLTLSNSSFQEVPGLEALASSPHLGPLLRVDVKNGSVAPSTRALLRQRLGGRFSAGGRKWPRVVTFGGWGRLLGEDD
jgi:uncharacterized protein (TIGR02996 family)